MSYDASNPATWSPQAATGFVVGLDIGQMQDHSALVVGGVWPQANHAIGIVEIRHFPLGMPLPEVAEAAAEAARRHNARIVCDTSNNTAFPSVLAPMLGSRPSDRLVAAVITNALTHAAAPASMLLALGGQRASIARWSLSKRELVETLGAEINAGGLRFAKIGDWEVLKDELNVMEREVRQSGSVSYSAPAGKHDDLVAALGLCVFGARRFGGLRSPRVTHMRSAPGMGAWT